MKRAFPLLIALVSVGCGEAIEGPPTGVEVDLVTGEVISHYRDPNRDWREYERDRLRALSLRVGAASALTVEQSKVRPANANFSNVPYWTDAEIKTLFRALRDERALASTDEPWFPRRISWMYPEDGCWTRAEVFAGMANNRGFQKPYRLYSFGNLRVTSPNEDPLDGDNVVTWGWHVVPLVRSADTGMPYALDPAIEPTRPLPWQEWLLRQVSSLNDVWVVVADHNAYSPSSPVTGGPDRYQDGVNHQQGHWLWKEMVRQRDELGYDPNVVLADYPPWRLDRYYVVSSTPAPLTVVPACSTCTGSDALSARCAADCP